MADPAAAPDPVAKDANAKLNGGAAPPNMMSSWGPTPQMSSGMTFGEVGRSGLRAFSGFIREEFLAELTDRQGAAKYREMMDTSPIVGAVMFAITATMRKVEWRVTPVNDSGEAQEAADFVDSCRSDMSNTWEDLIIENLSMLGYGFSCHEIVYKRRLGKKPPGTDAYGDPLPASEYDDGKVGWRRIPIRGQDTILKWFFDRNGGITGVTQQPWTGGLIDIPVEKLLLFRPTIHKQNPQGRSILRTSYVPYYFVKRLQEQEAILGERMGGFPVVRVPSQLIEAAKTDSAAALSLESFKKLATSVRIDEQMGAVLPSDVYNSATGPTSQRVFDFELITPQGGRGTAMNFEVAISRYNTSIMTSVLADFLTLGHEARGTQSLAVTKVDMFFQAIEGFLNANAAIYNRYALPRLWELNGLDPNLMPQIEPDIAQRVDLDVLSNFVLRLSQAGMPLFPNDELQSYILDAGGLPDISDDRALQAAGMMDEQLDMVDEQTAAVLDNTKNPPEPANTPLKKMLLASVARRMQRGTRYDIRGVAKFNQNHDERGRFTSGGGGGSSSVTSSHFTRVSQWIKTPAGRKMVIHATVAAASTFTAHTVEAATAHVVSEHVMDFIAAGAAGASVTFAAAADTLVQEVARKIGLNVERARDYLVGVFDRMIIRFNPASVGVKPGRTKKMLSADDIVAVLTICRDAVAASGGAADLIPFH